MTRDDPGLLIAFEGIDGAGKTTQTAMLVEFLVSVGEIVVNSKEPTNGPWGKVIRESATTGRLPLSDELEHFIEDRKEHVRDLILPALRSGKTVILDRYFYSTIAYQGARGNHVEDLTRQMLEIAPEPDVVLLLDVPPEVGLSRISEGRGETPNMFENVQSLRESRRIFRLLASSMENIILIDACQNVAAVRKELLNQLLEGILKRKYCAKAYGCDEPFACSYRSTGTCRWAKMRGKAAELIS